MPDDRGGRDLILAQGEYAFVQDQTKGTVSPYVGPTKVSLSMSDQLVRYDDRERRFVSGGLDDAIRPWPFAPEGQYIVLTNPARSTNEDERHPHAGSNGTAVLENGKKVNIHGPATFPLWPGQTAQVVPGHRLKSNEYLIVEVYNEQEAQTNWAQTVMKRQTSTKSQSQETGQSEERGEQGSESGKSPAVLPATDAEVPNLSVGLRLNIPGTEVSFYMPPTGISVIPDDDGPYVRQAVTLERLEYCILLDEDGNKRYVKGPSVVFPEPTETFIEQDGKRKFRAIELNEISGLYVKVIADYQDEGEEAHKTGEELFITGGDQSIYYPRPEHSIIKYGGKEIHYAVAIPEGEGRYVLDRKNGKIETVKGPQMFLPDPREEVIVQRILSDRKVRLWYPNSPDALAYNQQLRQIAERGGGSGSEYVTEREMLDAAESAPEAYSPTRRREEAAPMSLAADQFERGTSFTKPRTITLNTKFDGAVQITVWPEYAIQRVRRSGGREVVIGPRTILLDYDETLSILELSTGTPKSDDRTVKTVYLLTTNNRVSDIVEAETSDLCPVSIQLSFRVNFEGESEEEREKWFSVDNYIKLLTEHMRSMLRGVVKQHGIEEFYRDNVTIIRDAVLGVSKEGEGRPGRRFAENGMRIYDVEVLDVRIGDDDIAEMLEETQHQSVREALNIAQQERTRDNTRRRESIQQEVMELQAETARKTAALKLEELQRTAELELANAQRQLELGLASMRAQTEVETARRKAELDLQAILGQISEAELARQKAEDEQRLKVAQRELQQEIERTKAEAQAVIDKAAAVSPDLIAALQAFSDAALAGKMAESMAPLAILGGKSVKEVLGGLLAGTPLAKVLEDMNGHRDTRSGAAPATNR